MTKVTRGWPPSRRRAQAETIRRTRPWTRSTGPRTAAGKATCARNGYRRSPRSPTYLQFRALLRWQYRTTRAILKGLPLPALPPSPLGHSPSAPPPPSVTPALCGGPESHKHQPYPHPPDPRTRRG